MQAVVITMLLNSANQNRLEIFYSHLNYSGCIGNVLSAVCAQAHRNLRPADGRRMRAGAKNFRLI